MRPVLIVEFGRLPDNVRAAVPHMARILREIANRVEKGGNDETTGTAHWHIETEVTLDEIRDAIRHAGG